jgi:16S rRNA (guanine527-N7)-methyltransferase
VKAIVYELGLKNVIAEKTRSESVDQQYDFIISRAVTNMNNFIKIVDGKISLASKNSLKNGILYLKGGDLTSELKFFKTAKTININSYFSDPFFETKKIVYLPMPYVGKDTHLVD